jgi:hypothetical protein
MRSWLRLLWSFIVEPPSLIAVYSDGVKVVIGSPDWLWFKPNDRSPHLLVRLECDGVVYWERKP